MVFTSFNFLIFFPLVGVMYWITYAKYRWLLLLVSSYFFYINIKPVYALLVAGVTLSTYIFTRLIDHTNVESKKKGYMVVNIILILLPLFFFKYFSTLNNSLNALLEQIHVKWPLPEIELILPIGISFYTFMAIGYTVDVYNEEIRAEKNIGIVALFLSFFPLILSGPIERAKNMIPQFTAKRVFSYEMFVQGSKMMLWGYFMKLVVADRIGIYVDLVYKNFSLVGSASLLHASLLYPFQLYADLGGYSLIAIGTAKILGIQVMQNFNRPFFALSVSEFWRRWHISLISWLTDYIYTPLSFAFRKLRIWGIVFALILTFIISGFWHGAAFVFIVWGLLQGLFLSIEALINSWKVLVARKHKLSKKTGFIFICICVTFLVFAASLVLGRSANVSDALAVFGKIFSTANGLDVTMPWFLIYSGLAVVLLKDFTEEYFPNRFLLFENKYKSIRILSFCAIIILIILNGVFDGGQFIYFQF